MRAGDDPRFSLEIALIRIAEPRVDPSREALSRRIEDLESRLGKGSPAPTPQAPTKTKENPTPAAESSADPPVAEGDAGLEPEAVAEPPSAPAEDEVSVPDPAGGESIEVTIEIERVTSLWPAVVEHVRDSNSEMVSTLFHGARPIAIDREKSVIRIGFPSSAKFNKRKIESDQNAAIITESLHAVFGVPLRPAFELLEEEADEAPSASATVDSMDEGAVVDMFKDEFDAEEITDSAPAAPDTSTNDEAEEVG
jgi:hypothetical protein